MFLIVSLRYYMTNLEHQFNLKKIHFRSHHRGTKETDLFLGSFADKYLESFNDKELIQFEEILTYDDLDLNQWLLGKKDVPNEITTDVFISLMRHVNILNKNQ